jgi:DNA-3-methyladenine glycosylase
VLPRSFNDRDVVAVARDLLGKCLLRTTHDGLVVGRIVEVEAYLAKDDPANHAFRGQTRRNASMFGPPGHAYVYAIHSRWCLNAVTEPAGVASAVLIRAVEPLVGLPLMKQRRAARSGARPIAVQELARGPGRLCEAFAIDRALDGWDLTCGARLWIADASPALGGVRDICVARRVGVTVAQERELRFSIQGNSFVSKPKQR